MKTSSKKTTCIMLAAALLFTAVCSEGIRQSSAKAEKEKIVVYVGMQGKNKEGAVVETGKCAVQLDEGATADAAVRTVLDASEYQDKYEILDTGYGAYLESVNGMGTVQDGDNWYYWSFFVNGNYSNVGMGSYLLQDNDKISMIYTYQDFSTEALCFADDAAKNPTKEEASLLAERAEQQQELLAEAVYQKKFADGYIPGIEDADALYAVFSLLRAGCQKQDFYQMVYQKIVNQLYTIQKKGCVAAKVQGKEVQISEKSILESGTAEMTYAKLVLLLSAMGKDASDIFGINLIEKMALRSVYDASADSYTRDATMLLAFDSKAYALPKGENYVTRTELVNKITEGMDEEIRDAIAWGMVDMPAMLLQPLSLYCTENNPASAEQMGTFSVDKVRKTVKKTLCFLETMQSGDGCFGDGFSSNNAWTLAQVMVTLGQFGIDAASEEDGSDFIKNGCTLYDAAGAFLDVSTGKVDDTLLSYQPEQLLRGLNALLRVSRGRPCLFQLSGDVGEIKEVTPEELESGLPEQTVEKIPKTTGLKIKKKKNKRTVTWKKINGASYKVAYSTSKNKLSKLKKGQVKGSKITVVNVKKAKKVFKKLKQGKTYYVRVCAYQTAGGKTIYGEWSVVKRI